MAGRKRDGPKKPDAFEKFINQIKELDSFNSGEKMNADEFLEDIQKRYKIKVDKEYLDIFRYMMKNAQETRTAMPKDFIACLRIILLEELYRVNWDKATAVDEFLEKIIRIFIFGFCAGNWFLSEEEEE